MLYLSESAVTVLKEFNVYWVRNTYKYVPGIHNCSHYISAFGEMENHGCVAGLNINIKWHFLCETQIAPKNLPMGDPSSPDFVLIPTWAFPTITWSYYTMTLTLASLPTSTPRQGLCPVWDGASCRQIQGVGLYWGLEHVCVCTFVGNESLFWCSVDSWRLGGVERWAELKGLFQGMRKGEKRKMGVEPNF